MRELGWNVVWITAANYKRNRRFMREEEAKAYCEYLEKRKSNGEILAYKCVREKPLSYYLT